MKKSKETHNQDLASRQRSTNRVIQAGIAAAKRAGMDEKSIQLLQSMLRKM